MYGLMDFQKKFFFDFFSYIFSKFFKKFLSKRFFELYICFLRCTCYEDSENVWFNGLLKNIFF